MYIYHRLVVKMLSHVKKLTLDQYDLRKKAFDQVTADEFKKETCTTTWPLRFWCCSYSYHECILVLT